MSRRARTIYFYLLAGVFVLLIPFIILYASGYRLSDGFDVVETGGIYVYVPQAGASIYIDGEFRRRTGNFQKELFVQNLEPQSRHTVFVERPGFSVWQKQVSVDAQEVTALYPFLVPEGYSLRDIPELLSEKTATLPAEENPEYAELLLEFEKEELELQENVIVPQTIEDLFTKIRRNNIAIWSDSEGVHAEWVSGDDWIPRYFCTDGDCQKEIMVVTPKEEVLTLEYYPDRDDVVIYSTPTGVYVAEMDIRSIQTKRKLYSGVDVDMRVLNDDRIIIRDGENLFELEA